MLGSTDNRFSQFCIFLGVSLLSYSKDIFARYRILCVIPSSVPELGAYYLHVPTVCTKSVELAVSYQH